MQGKVYKYVERIVNEFGLKDKKTIDIGSLNINGSIKQLFTNYIGLDMRAGNGVDVIANSHNIPFEDNSFEVVTCLETLEHDDDPFKTITEIYRVLKDDGIVIIAASGIHFHKHSHPSDYWRFTAEGMKVLLKRFLDVSTSEDNNEAYGYGKK